MTLSGLGEDQNERMTPGYPRSWEADVLLRNGRPVHLRPILPADGPALSAFHDSLSDRTVYFRFFAPKPHLSEADVQRFTNVDHHDRVALVALDAGRLVGVGRFDAVGDGTAEVAFVIHDDVQGQGLGSILLEHLAEAARECGVRRFVAEVLPDNTRMLATFREAGFAVEQHREVDVLALAFDITPTETSRAVSAAREHRFEARSIHRLLHPEVVAVVGARRSGSGLGHVVLDNIARAGFRGRLVAVHPQAAELHGIPCVPSLAEAADVDLAVVVVPAPHVSDTVRDASRAGVHALVVVSGGFDDSESGARLQSELVDLVHRTGMRLVGPNALGVINTDPEVRLNASLVTHPPQAGTIGLLCQSGALSGAILDRFVSRGVGLSSFVSAGNRADISGNDLLQYWEDDVRTSVVALYLESIGNARKFVRLVRRLAVTKPVVMVRSGGAGRRHPLGHHVSATQLSQSAVDQVLADSGLTVVPDIEGLVDVTRVLAQQPLPRSSGIAIVGNSDAVGVLAANAVSATGLHVVRAPVALARRETPEAYRQAVQQALADPAVGILLAVYVPPVEQEFDTAIRDVLSECRQEGTAVLSVLWGTSGVDERLTAFEDVERAVAAADAVARYAAWRRTRDAEPDARGEGPPWEVGPRHGDGACALLAECDVRLSRVDESGMRGLRVRLLEDPQFGDVVAVGVDDPIAEALDDVGYRPAPLSKAQAGALLDSLAAVSVLGLTDEDRGRLSDLIARVSALPAAVRGVDLRGVRTDAHHGVIVLDALVEVGVREPEPTARRL